MSNLTVYDYNIHDIFRFRFVGNKNQLEYIDKQYSFFRVEKQNKEIDMELFIGDFKKPSSNLKIVSRKYHVGHNILYCMDSYKVAKWKFAIENVDDVETTVHFHGNTISHLLLHKFIVDPLIRYKMAGKDFSPIHSSCILDGGFAYILAASANVGKTSTMLYSTQCGSQHMSDEYTMLSKDGYAYSYPTPLKLRTHNLKNMPFVKKGLNAGDILQIHLRTLFFKLTLGYADLAHSVEIEKIFPSEKIPMRAKLKKFFLLVKSPSHDASIKMVSSDEIARKMMVINKFEMLEFNNYMNAYLYANPESRISTYWDDYENNIESGLKDVTCYEVYVPIRYSPQTFDVIYRRIKNPGE